MDRIGEMELEIQGLEHLLSLFRKQILNRLKKASKDSDTSYILGDVINMFDGLFRGVDNG